MEDLITSLQLLNVFKDILEKYDNVNGEITNKIKDCIKICSKDISQNYLIQFALTHTTHTTHTTKEEIQLNNQIESTELLSALLGGNQEVTVDNANFDPSVFDTLGSGLASLLKVQVPEQVKSELQRENQQNNQKEQSFNSLTFNIKKK